MNILDKIKVDTREIIFLVLLNIFLLLFTILIWNTPVEELKQDNTFTILFASAIGSWIFAIFYFIYFNKK